MDRILTRNPDPKKTGSYVEISQYEIVRDAILSILKREGEQNFADLMDMTGRELVRINFVGSRSWYYITVKLDLEAKGLIKADRQRSPEMISV